MKIKKSAALTLPAIVRETADRFPDRLAVLAPGREPITYGRLVEQIERTAGYLRACGVERNDSIAIVLPNGPAMAIALLASATAAVSAPLNPAYTEIELAYFIEDLDARAMIVPAGADSAATAIARKRGIPVLQFSDDLIVHCEESFVLNHERTCSKQDFSPQPDDLALRLYTSGTTATPKRVPLSHRNLASSAKSIAATLQLNAQDRCLNIMPLYHIHGLAGALLSSLAAGSSVALPPAFNVTTFWHWLEELQPTWYTAVPTIHQAILAEASVEILRNCKLRFVRSSSAALPTKVAVEMEELFKVPVIEAYGMTEAAHQMASNPLPPAERKHGSVGNAAGSQVAIIDERAGLLPPGERGEIAVRGPNMTSGYEKNTEANATAFTDGWFRTGDQGYLDEKGYLFITGRLKEMINKGGEKISPREIDEALLDNPDISQAVAFAVPHRTLGEDVAAAVVLAADRQTTASRIRELLGERLAGYKIPSQLFIVDEIPKSATGKVQRIALAERFADQLGLAGSAPQGEIEAKVAQVYAEVLGIEQVSGSENFFALGGDSLRAFQVITRIRAALDVNLSIGTIFMKPTVNELARVIQEAKAGSSN